MTITLRNNFHNSEVNVRIAEWGATLTESQAKRVRKELCGLSECTCGAVRGPQGHTDGDDYFHIEAISDWDDHGETWNIQAW